MEVAIYTDGSADNNSDIKDGGYGVVFVAKIKGVIKIKKHSSSPYIATTNNRMEMKAILYALQNTQTGHKLFIFSDSQLCIRAINEWIPNWLKKDKLYKKKNWEIWKEIIEEIRRHKKAGSKLNFLWIRGHNGNKYNEIADELAGIARLKKEDKLICKPKN